MFFRNMLMFSQNILMFLFGDFEGGKTYRQ